MRDSNSSTQFNTASLVPRKPREGDELTQMAQETFNSPVRVVTSRQHSVLICFALQEQQGKTVCDPLRRAGGRGGGGSRGGGGNSVCCYPTMATREAGTNVGDPLCLLHTAPSFERYIRLPSRAGEGNLPHAAGLPTYAGTGIYGCNVGLSSWMPGPRPQVLALGPMVRYCQGVTYALYVHLIQSTCITCREHVQCLHNTAARERPFIKCPSGRSHLVWSAYYTPPNFFKFLWGLEMAHAGASTHERRLTGWAVLGWDGFGAYGSPWGCCPGMTEHR